MKSLMKLFTVCAAVIALAACSKSRPEQMEMADNVKIECTPEVLENVGGTVNATITVTYPDGYFHPDVIMVVTPVLVYDGGQMTGAPFTYQGDRIKDNYKVVKSSGGTVTEKLSFKFVPGMAQSYLELRSVAFYGEKRINIPAVKVAEGVLNTCALADVSGVYKYKEDGYQHIITKTSEGRILYDVNSSNIKGSELRNSSIRELEAALAEIAADERYSIKGTRIEAYASPEGGQEYNAKLSDKRATSAEKAWNGISKGVKADDLQVKSLGQDWEGFRGAVESSNIEDKDLILRVLSMYDDPAVREREIRNMSKVYTEINHKVFPELRRARFVADIEYKNYTDEELEELSQRALSLLDEPGVLRVAANTESVERKSMLYQYAVSRFESAKAGYNLSVLALDEGKPGVAELYLGKLDKKDADADNVKGVVALQRGRVSDAKAVFEATDTPEAKANLGTVAILEGDYATAVKYLEGTGSDNEALAYLLNGDAEKAEAVLKGDSATADYLRAVIAARAGKSAEVGKWLESAQSKDASLKERAAKDAEFVKFR